MNAIALNHRVAPKASLTAFLDLARSLGVTDVEIRNALPGVAIGDGPSRGGSVGPDHPVDQRALSVQHLNGGTSRSGGTPDQLCGRLRRQGHRHVPFERCGLQADADARLAAVCEALGALAPMLRKAGLVGLVEPLGFPEGSLRLKRDAVAAIDAVDGGDAFKLVQDTFHHHVVGETELFPERTGLIPASGVTDTTVAREAMKEAHRELVDAGDRLDDLGQIRAPIAAGYTGPLSFEPFADSVSDASDIRSLLAESIASVQQAEGSPAR